jgi:hypothetical protein
MLFETLCYLFAALLVVCLMAPKKVAEVENPLMVLAPMFTVHAGVHVDVDVDVDVNVNVNVGVGVGVGVGVEFSHEEIEVNQLGIEENPLLELASLFMLIPVEVNKRQVFSKERLESTIKVLNDLPLIKQEVCGEPHKAKSTSKKKKEKAKMMASTSKGFAK